jgi:hypothetical protein
MEKKTMNAKSIAIQIIENLPKTSTMEDIIHTLYMTSKTDKGEQIKRPGKGVPEKYTTPKQRKGLHKK